MNRTYAILMEKALPLMDSHTRVCLLLDFYGQLLSDRARETLELHFAEDMTLAEIADTDSISRQAVHDRVRRALEALETFEIRLGLADRFIRQKDLAADALAALDAQDTPRARAILARLADTL
jgi:predicted DNA-binding protein YlxM (UPF0122 family)